MTLESKDEELVTLIARCALRDQQALRLLYDRVAPFLNGVAYRILGSDELSNEALQDAFIQIWNNAASYRVDKAKPMTWLCSIVRYRAIDKLEKEQRHSSSARTDVEIDDLPGSEKTNEPEDGYARGQASLHIQECLGAMNDKVRLCIELAYLNGYSREELAVHFDAKINTIKSWLHRGSERLKQCLIRKTQTNI